MKAKEVMEVLNISRATLYNYKQLMAVEIKLI